MILALVYVVLGSVYGGHPAFAVLPNPHTEEECRVMGKLWTSNAWLRTYDCVPIPAKEK